MLAPLNCVFYLKTPQPDGSPGGLSLVRVTNGGVVAGGYSGIYYGNIINQTIPGDGTLSVEAHGWFYHGSAPEDASKPVAVVAECAITIDATGAAMQIQDENGVVLLDVAHQALDPDPRATVLQGLKALANPAA